MGEMVMEQSTWEESFKITDDGKADWALEIIAKERAERDRLIELCDSKIKELEERKEQYEKQCANRTSWLETKLLEYFDTVERKKTKTKESYKLVSGTLVLKKPKAKIKHDDAVLIEQLAGTEFVENVPKIKWADYKKQLEIVGDEVIDTETGEVVEGCTVEPVVPEFVVEI